MSGVPKFLLGALKNKNEKTKLLFIRFFFAQGGKDSGVRFLEECALQGSRVTSALIKACTIGFHTIGAGVLSSVNPVWVGRKRIYDVQRLCCSAACLGCSFSDLCRGRSMKDLMTKCDLSCILSCDKG